MNITLKYSSKQDEPLVVIIKGRALNRKLIRGKASSATSGKGSWLAATVTKANPSNPTSMVHRSGIFSSKASIKLGKVLESGSGSVDIRVSDRIAANDAIVMNDMACAIIKPAFVTGFLIFGIEGVLVVRHIA